MPRKPAITVVIPTYNWSAALACAIRSVLLQTVQDFELFVVGDGCTDDSESVVASFNDARIRWHNRTAITVRNGRRTTSPPSGRRATGSHIWGTTTSGIRPISPLFSITAHRETADIVTSTMILYGPPGSGIRGIAGIFSRGVFSPGDSFRRLPSPMPERYSATGSDGAIPK